jgi:hypothetical protein
MDPYHHRQVIVLVLILLPSRRVHIEEQAIFVTQKRTDGRREVTISYQDGRPAFAFPVLLALKIGPCLSPPLARYRGTPPDLIGLFLLTGALSAVTIATLMYTGFPRPGPASRW